MFRNRKIFFMSLLALTLLLAACGGGEPEVVEVTRVVTEQVEVPVTEVVEVDGETVVQTRIVTQEVEVVVEPTEPPIPQGGSIIESSFSDASTLNPIITSDNASSTVIGRMFLPLMNLEPFTGSVVGQLAESWEVSEDGLIYTFNLRDDVFWTDGTPFTANDVAFTWEAINTDEVASPRRSNFATVDSWEVIDDNTISLTLNSLDCTILSNLTTGMLPAHVYNNDVMSIPDHPESNAPTVTNGPFSFVEWVPDDHITLAANPDYYLGAPNVDTWTYRVFADQSAELAALLAGEVDWTGVNPGFVSVIEGEIASGKDLNISKFFSNSYNFVGLNLANPENPQNGWDDLDGDGKFTEGEPPLAQDPHPILGDLAVRQAIAHSIDYTGIINKVAFGQGGPIVANVWPSIEWAYNNDLVPYSQDLELAQQILEDAGWVDANGDGIREKDGQQLSFSLMTNAGNETRENIGIVMKDTLDGIGFNIELDFIEFGTVVQNLLGQTYDAVIIGFGGGPPEPDDRSQFSYRNDEVGAGFNFVSYYNPVVEQNLQDGLQVPGCSESERASFYQSNQQEIYNDLPYNFLYVPLANAVWWDRLQNIEPNAWNTRYNLQDWYLTQ